MFQRENDIAVLTTQRFASGEAILIDCKSKKTRLHRCCFNPLVIFSKNPRYY